MLGLVCSSATVRAIASPKFRFIKPIANAYIERPILSDHRRFSTDSGSSAARKVVGALNSQIKAHEQALINSRGAPSNLPFKIKDNDHFHHIVLTRDFGDEKIDVTVNPVHDSSETEDSDSDTSSFDSDSDSDSSNSDDSDNDNNGSDTSSTDSESSDSNDSDNDDNDSNKSSTDSDSESSTDSESSDSDNDSDDSDLDTPSTDTDDSDSDTSSTDSDSDSESSTDSESSDNDDNDSDDSNSDTSSTDSDSDSDYSDSEAEAENESEDDPVEPWRPAESVTINVSISKENKGTLDIGANVSAADDGFFVERISFTEPNNDVPSLTCYVEPWTDLEFAFRSLIEERGITQESVGFLYDYMVEKRKRGGTVWVPRKKPETDDLKKLKNFFEDWNQ